MKSRYRQVLDELQPHYAWVIPAITALVGAATTAYGSSQQKRAAGAAAGQGALGQAQAASGAGLGYKPTAQQQGQQQRLQDLPGVTQTLAGLTQSQAPATTRNLGDVLRQDQSRFSPAGQAPVAQSNIPGGYGQNLYQSAAGQRLGDVYKPADSSEDTYRTIAGLLGTGSDLAQALTPRPGSPGPIPHAGNTNYDPTALRMLLARRRGGY